MSHREPLAARTVAISISEPPGLAALGLGREHLDDAMAEIARHLLAMGAHLMYGGDLRPGGFTEVLFELVARHRRAGSGGDGGPGVLNFLAWPVHAGMQAEEVERLAEGLRGVAELVCLTLDGEEMDLDARRGLAPRPASEAEWMDGLTAMRQVMTHRSDARVVLGGRVDQFKGRMPGVAEEALYTLRAGKPLFLLGGFGGCARDVAEELGLAPRRSAASAQWPARDEFARCSVGDLNNGLDAEENATLATTLHIDQAVTLILRGLLRLDGNRSAPE